MTMARCWRKALVMDLVFTTPPRPASLLRATIRGHVRLDEAVADAEILAAADTAPEARDRIAETARRLVTAVRRERHGKGGIDAFLHEYALSSQEGVALLCLAEALLRIPDAETVDRLIRDKLGEADWARHLGHSNSVFVNASTWALMLTGRLLRPEPPAPDLRAALRRFAMRSGEPVVRAGGDRGDAHPRPSIRHGPHDRGSARPRARSRGRGLPPFLRHAGRSGAYRGRCGTLSRGVREGHRCDWAGRGGSRGRSRTRHLGQIIGFAPALRDGAARARARRDDAALACARRAGTQGRYRVYDRRRGGRPA